MGTEMVARSVCGMSGVGAGTRHEGMAMLEDEDERSRVTIPTVGLGDEGDPGPPVPAVCANARSSRS